MWNASERAALEREYVRIGGTEARWPYPSPDPTPQEFLEMLRTVPDGSGLSGYLEAMKARASRRDR